jgi:hypothetical protein
MACLSGFVSDGVASGKRQCKRVSDGMVFAAQNAGLPCTNTGNYVEVSGANCVAHPPGFNNPQ